MDEEPATTSEQARATAGDGVGDEVVDVELEGAPASRRRVCPPLATSGNSEACEFSNSPVPNLEDDAKFKQVTKKRGDDR